MSQLKRRHLGNTSRQQLRRYVPSFGRGGEALSFASVDYIYLAVCQLEYFSQRRVVIFVVFSLLYPLHSYLFVAIARYCLSCLVLRGQGVLNCNIDLVVFLYFAMVKYCLSLECLGCSH